MQIHHHRTASEAAFDEWVRITGACKILQCGPSRLYEILADIEIEDPDRIIKTFIFRSPNSQRGTRLFEANSLRKFMAARYLEATQTGGEENGLVEIIREEGK
jgi:hypothetical protein